MIHGSLTVLMTVTHTYFSSEAPSLMVEDQQSPGSAPVSGVGSSAGVCAGVG